MVWHAVQGSLNLDHHDMISCVQSSYSGIRVDCNRSNVLFSYTELISNVMGKESLVKLLCIVNTSVN